MLATMLTFLGVLGFGKKAAGDKRPLPAVDVTAVKRVRGRELLWLFFEPRGKGFLTIGLWVLAVTCTSTAAMLPREAALAVLALALACYAVVAAIMVRTIRQRSTPPLFDMAICHTLYRLGVTRPFAYARARPDAVQAYESVVEQLSAVNLFRQFRDVRQIASELTGPRVHALAMLAFMLDEPKTAERIPALIVERRTTDPLQIHSLLTAVAPGTAGPLGAGAL